MQFCLVACIIYTTLSFLETLPPPVFSVFPYTTLFRSGVAPRRGRGTPARASRVARRCARRRASARRRDGRRRVLREARAHRLRRSEEHTSELQSPYDLVCRLLLEKKKTSANILH